MQKKIKVKIEFIVNILFIIIIVGLVYLFFQYGLSLIMPLILALILVAILNPLIMTLHNKLKFNKKIASVIILALLYLMIGTLLTLLAIKIIFLVRDAFAAFPSYYQSTISPMMMGIADKIEEFLGRFLKTEENNVNTLRSVIMDSSQKLIVSISQSGISLVTRLIANIPSFIMNLIFTVLLSFFMSVQYEKISQFVKKMVPPKARETFRKAKTVLKDSVLKYIKAYCILMVITFFELTIGLFFLRVPQFVTIAAGIAIFDALPFFGTGAIMIPWVAIELLQTNYSFAVGLVILFGIISLVRNFIEPKIVGDQLGLNPVVSLLSVYFGYRLFGVLGMICFPIIIQIALSLNKNGVFIKQTNDKENTIAEHINPAEQTK